MTIKGYEVKVESKYQGRTLFRKRGKYEVTVFIYADRRHHVKVSYGNISDVAPDGPKVMEHARYLANVLITQIENSKEFTI